MPSRPNDGVSGGQTSRINVRGREIERRRMRGEAACAECWRLKLKCDKKIPCSSCLRRGCQAICPKGSLSSTTSSRVVFSSARTTQRKLLDMSDRIRQLEDVVKILQALQSNKPHPLLDEEGLQIKFFDLNADEADEDTEEEIELSDALGTLAITDEAEMQFMGRHSTEVLFMTSDIKAPIVTDKQDMGNMLPFKPGIMHEGLARVDVLQSIESRLPTHQHARTLMERYLGYVAWHSRLVQHDQIFEEIMPTVYQLGTTSVDGKMQRGDCNNTIYMHRLAMFFALLACGATVTSKLPVNTTEAAQYDTLARVCLCLRSPFQGTTLESVQTICLLAHYQWYTLPTLSLEPALKLLIFGLTLGLGIGLHRDPSRWEMEPKLRERRRTVFWEIFSSDKWKSLETGRPSIFNLAEIDCEFARDDAGGVATDGTFRPSYWRWKQMFAKEVVGPVAEFMALAKPVKYAHVLELDRKVREFRWKPVPAELSGPATDTDTIMRRSNVGLYREMVLLTLHRNFFARAMLDDADDAMSGPYSASVLAGYASSISFLKLIRTQYLLQSPLLIRQWFLWIHALVAGVIIGTIALKGPSPAAVQAAHKELESAIELFEYANAHPICRAGLKILRRLLERIRSRSQTSVSPSSLAANLGGLTQGLYSDGGRSADVDEELRLLGGSTRTVNVSSKPPTSTNITATALKPAARAPIGFGWGTTPRPAPSTSSRQSLHPTQNTVRHDSHPFAVDASVPSVFCPPGRDAPASNEQDSYEEFACNLPQGPAENYGFDTSTDAIANALALPAVLPDLHIPHEPDVYPEASDWHTSFVDMEVPVFGAPAPPTSDQLALLASFCDPTEPNVVQGLFEGVSADGLDVGGNGNGAEAGAGGVGPGAGVGGDADAGSGLGVFYESNPGFDFLVDSMHSSSEGTGTGVSVQGAARNGFSSAPAQDDADAASAWHALLDEMQALQRASDPGASGFTQDLPVFV